MPEVNIEILVRIIHLIQQHLGCGDFQVEMGLSGNILMKDFSTQGLLATHGWFKNLCELCHRYEVKLEILSHHLPLLRVGCGSITIMGMAVRLNVWNQKELVWINRVRKYKKLYQGTKEGEHGPSPSRRWSELAIGAPIDHTANLESALTKKDPGADPVPDAVHIGKKLNFKYY